MQFSEVFNMDKLRKHPFLFSVILGVLCYFAMGLLFAEFDSEKKESATTFYGQF